MKISVNARVDLKMNSNHKIRRLSRALRWAASIAPQPEAS